MIVHFSAHISKWELVCKFGVILCIFIISCLSHGESPHYNDSSHYYWIHIEHIFENNTCITKKPPSLEWYYVYLLFRASVMGNHLITMIHHIIIGLILNIFLKTIHVLQKSHQIWQPKFWLPNLVLYQTVKGDLMRFWLSFLCVLFCKQSHRGPTTHMVYTCFPGHCRWNLWSPCCDIEITSPDITPKSPGFYYNYNYSPLLMILKNFWFRAFLF